MISNVSIGTFYVRICKSFYSYWVFDLASFLFQNVEFQAVVKDSLQLE